MINSNAYTVRRGTPADAPTLAWLGALAGKPAVRLPTLIGDVDGMPAAAISQMDGRVVADPFHSTPGLVTQLRLHRSGWRGRPARAELAAQLRTVIPFMV
jgi:hypothetical protein